MISTYFIADLEEKLAYKKAERNTIRDQLVLLDVKIDRYDRIIKNIDKDIFPLIDEINDTISAVKTAYDNRIAIGCKSDLYWELKSTSTYTAFNSGSYSQVTKSKYKVSKNPDVMVEEGYYGVKYYRRPQNQDYGANIVKEILGNIESEESELTVVSNAGTFNLQVGDTVVDNIEDPYVFSSGNLPEIIGFGTASVLGITTYFEGSISFGSTILVNTGIGSTLEINIGDAIVLQNVLSPNTTVVGFGTGLYTIEILDSTGSNFIDTTVVGDALILSSAAIGVGTTSIFPVGQYSNFPSLILNSPASHSVTDTNFTIIRSTQSKELDFDWTNNPIDPVTIGILNKRTVGVGHTIDLIKNGNPKGPFQWREVLGDYDPEPKCGNDNARYYPGNNSWPIRIAFSYNQFIPSSSESYAMEGDEVVVSIGSTTNLFEISTTSAKPPYYNGTVPSNSVCASYASTITAREATRDEVIARNVPKIKKLIATSSILRELRDGMESQAFAIVQSQASIDVEIKNLRRGLKSLKSTDFAPYEPPLSASPQRFSSFTPGISS